MPTPNRSLRFGVFELRPATLELYKGAIRMKLRPQAFQVLEVLSENSGEVVSRDALRQKLWPEQPYVDFEHGLNTAVKELRGVLNDSAAEPRFIETLPRIGYRLIVPVTVEEGSGRHAAYPDTAAPMPETAASGGARASAESHSHSPATPVSDSSAAQARESGHRPNRAGWWIGGAAAAAIVVAAAIILSPIFIAWFGTRPASKNELVSMASQPKQVLAVLPFENLTGDPSQDYFTDGLTEEMIGQLGQLDPQHLAVIGRNSVMRYKTNHEATDAIGRELGAAYLVEGSVRRDSDKVRVTAELVKVGNQANVWSRQYDRQLQDVLALQSEIAREIAGEIHLTLSAENSAAAHNAEPRAPASTEAYDLYLRGLYFWNKRGSDNIGRAADYFQRSVAKDPNSARAYAALADSEALYAGYAGVPPKDLLVKARESAERAVTLDPNSAEAHAALAVVAQDCQWDWPTAEREYRRAIELNPNYATAHHWYGEYLGLMGRFDESRAEFERARQLDPLSLIILADRAVALYYARDYDGAMKQFESVLDLDPAFPRTAPVPFIYLEKSKNDEAIAWVEQWKEPMATGPWYWSAKSYVDARVGKDDDARIALKNLIRMNARQQVDPLYLANAYTGLKDADHAFDSLEKARAVHSVSLTAIKVDPIYDPLRSDPRYAQLLHEMNFPQ